MGNWMLWRKGESYDDAYERKKQDDLARQRIGLARPCKTCRWYEYDAEVAADWRLSARFSPDKCKKPFGHYTVRDFVSGEEKEMPMYGENCHTERSGSGHCGYEGRSWEPK